MRISPISYINYNQYNKKASVKQQPNFTAHPDFEKLKKRYNVTASGYFRRGEIYGLPSKGYMDIIGIFNKIFGNGENKKRNMLIIGVGNSQEPFSYLATIKCALRGRPLKKNVDLYTVDLQSKPKKIKLFDDSFYDLPYRPEYSEESFVLDVKEDKRGPKLHYRVDDEILDLVERSYNNPKKSKWDTRIQDVIQDYPDEMFDIVSANNVLPYILNKEDEIRTVKHIKRILKPNGYFITDPRKFSYMKGDTLDGLVEVKEGIYKKIG